MDLLAASSPAAIRVPLRHRLALPHLHAIVRLDPPLTGTRQGVGIAVTVLLVVGYCVFYGAYVVLHHQALGSHGEDLGIMDQTLWNSLHGHFWRQTICNPISDLDCLGEASRWGIHFEPLMLMLLPLYAVFPHPETLQIAQVIGVALGAIPAYLLGSRRTRSAVAGIALAVLYLGLPTLRAATTSDFHMVTFAAPILLLALYAVYARHDRLLIIACVLALGTKEQIPLDVLMIALLLFGQGRRRLAVAVAALAVGWGVLALVVLHVMSPLGLSPAVARYGIGGNALTRIPLLFTDPARIAYYLRVVLNTGGVALLAPWALALVLPSVLLNALSTYPHQYTGAFHYSADIAPFLVVATLEGSIVLWRWCGRRGVAEPLVRRLLFGAVLLAALGMMLVLPQSRAIDAATLEGWPTVTAHARLAATFFAMIPPTAAISAQAALVPHLSERRWIYQFPSGIDRVEYILLDQTTTVYPEPDAAHYRFAVWALTATEDFVVVRAEGGFVLFQRARPLPTASP